MPGDIAVIDIGMTNKKISVYGRDLGLLESLSRRFEPLEVGGIQAHDLEGMEEWFLDALADLGRRHRIEAIAVSAHGATMVAVGADGRPCAPCVFYTHQPDEGFEDVFRALAGDPLDLQESTGTAPFGALLNMAKGILFLREAFPEGFAKAQRLLFLPQYWGFRLSGQAAPEVTSLGCHSYLWDWRKGAYSALARELGLERLLPGEPMRPWDRLGPITGSVAARTGLDPGTIVAAGIHDSNASLLLHLVKEEGDFILNSTGTWCVAMHPQEDYGFRPGELGKGVFFLRSAFGRPMKTAIFPGGMEFDAWSRIMAGGAGRILPEAPEEAYREVVERREAFILPGLIGDSGLFPRSRAALVQGGIRYAYADIASGTARPSLLGDPALARAALDLSLAIQTLAATEAAGAGRGCVLRTDGGFSANRGYNAILAAVTGSAYLTEVKEATSLGTAIVALAALEGGDPGRLAGCFELGSRAVEPMGGLEGFNAYRSAWVRMAEARA
jgi:sugar (pentulose or hexulose) kinase